MSTVLTLCQRIERAFADEVLRGRAPIEAPAGSAIAIYRGGLSDDDASGAVLVGRASTGAHCLPDDRYWLIVRAPVTEVRCG